MRYDQDLKTAGYCEADDRLQFKLIKNSTGDVFDLTSSDIPAWEDNGILFVSSLSISSADILNGFELNQIYPNPFNPATTISFTVAEQMDLKLVVYDMQGREIETLFNKSHAPGSYDVSWSAKDMSSGIYFARLSTSTHEQIYKLMLIK